MTYANRSSAVLANFALLLPPCVCQLDDNDSDLIKPIFSSSPRYIARKASNCNDQYDVQANLHSAFSPSSS